MKYCHYRISSDNLCCSHHAATPHFTAVKLFHVKWGKFNELVFAQKSPIFRRSDQHIFTHLPFYYKLSCLYYRITQQALLKWTKVVRLNEQTNTDGRSFNSQLYDKQSYFQDHTKHHTADTVFFVKKLRTASCELGHKLLFLIGDSGETDSE